MKKVIIFISIAIVLFLAFWWGSHQESSDGLVVINYPQEGDEISSPLVVKGKAVGNWFFEGDFPVIVTDWDGMIIGEGYATAKGEWMTEDFVEFEGTVEFVRDERSMLKDNGAIIFQKDNPSGLPEHDDAREIPIYFE
jgi:hypothetical protein